MDTRKQELLTILGHALAAAVDLHERQQQAALAPLQRAAQLLPLLDGTADRIEAWARRGRARGRIMMNRRDVRDANAAAPDATGERNRSR